MKKKKVLILGSTGLTGGELLKLILENDSFEKVYILTRNPVDIHHEKLNRILTDFSDLKQILNEFSDVDIIYSCLGTTRSKTPDLKLYRRIEYGITREVVFLLKDKGLEQLHFISAISPNENSSNFYIKIKGEAESAFRKLNIKYTFFYRPSLITGSRKEKRFFEEISSVLFKVINPLLIGKLKKYRSIKAEDIAKAMVKVSLNPENHTTIIESDEIREISNS